MIIFRHKGDFHNTERFLRKLQNEDFLKRLNEYGDMGVEALAAATPKRTGRTAASWSYTVEKGSGHATLAWTNSNYNQGEQIAILIQYGHGTGWGTYVQGTDYINPAMKKVFQQIADAIWEEVINS